MSKSAKSGSPNPTSSPQNSAGPVTKKKTGVARWSFIAFMGALTILFAFLGNWQLNRLAQKTVIISAIEERINNYHIGLPPLAEWVGFDSETYNFRPLVVKGTFDHSKTVLVFTALVDPVGMYSGPGYWVVAPLMLENGGVLFVNRGFVPEGSAARFSDGGTHTSGPVTIAGIGRVSEQANSFTPGSDFQNRIDWVRNIERLSHYLENDQKPVAPIYLDAGITESGALPQGGETKLRVVNRHFEYVLTWFSLAILTPVLLLFWVRKGPDN